MQIRWVEILCLLPYIIPGSLAQWVWCVRRVPCITSASWVRFSGGFFYYLVLITYEKLSISPASHISHLKSNIRTGSVFCLSLSELQKIIFLELTTTYCFFQPCRLMFCLFGIDTQPSNLESETHRDTEHMVNTYMHTYKT